MFEKNNSFFVDSGASIDKNIGRLINKSGKFLNPTRSFKFAIDRIEADQQNINNSKLPLVTQAILTKSITNRKPIQANLYIYNIGTETSKKNVIGKIQGKFNVVAHDDKTISMNIKNKAQNIKLPGNFQYKVEMKFGNYSTQHTGVHFNDDGNNSRARIMHNMYDTEKYDKYKKFNLPTAVMTINKTDNSQSLDGATVFVNFDIGKEPKRVFPGIGQTIGQYVTRVDNNSFQTNNNPNNKNYVGNGIDDTSVEKIQKLFNGINSILKDSKVSNDKASIATGFHDEVVDGISDIQDFHMARSQNCDKVNLLWGSMSVNFITLSFVSALKKLRNWDEVSSENLVAEILDSDKRGKELRVILNSIYAIFYKSNNLNTQERSLPTIIELLSGSSGLSMKPKNNIDDLEDLVHKTISGDKNQMNEFNMANMSKSIATVTDVEMNESEFILNLATNGSLIRYPSSFVSSTLNTIESAILSFLIVRLANMTEIKFDGTPEDAFIKFVNLYSGIDGEFDNVVIGVTAGVTPNTIVPSNTTSLYNASYGIASSFCDLEYFARLWVSKYEKLKDVISHGIRVSGNSKFVRVLGWEYTKTNGMQMLYQIGGMKNSNISYMFWAPDYGIWSVINVTETEVNRTDYSKLTQNLTTGFSTEIKNIVKTSKLINHVTDASVPYNSINSISANHNKNISSDILKHISGKIEENQVYTSQLADPISANTLSIKFKSNGKFGEFLDNQSGRPISKFVYDGYMGSFREVNGTNNIIGQPIEITKDYISLSGIPFMKNSSLKHEKFYKKVAKDGSLNNLSSNRMIDAVFNTDDSEINVTNILTQTPSDPNKVFTINLFHDDDDDDYNSYDQLDNLNNNLSSSLSSSSASSSTTNTTSNIGNPLGGRRRPILRRRRRRRPIVRRPLKRFKRLRRRVIPRLALGDLISLISPPYYPYPFLIY